MNYFLYFLPSKGWRVLCLMVVLCATTACDSLVKSGGYNYPDKPHRDTYANAPATQAGVTDICTAGPKARSGNPSSYKVLGRWYKVMPSACGYSETGLASWYGPGFHGKRTSSGERYDMHAISAAHKTLPIPVRVRVTNLDNGKSLIVRVNDRGPFHKGRIIDLSKTAARQLGVLATGTARVRVTVVDRPPNPSPTPTSLSEPVETFALPKPNAPVTVSDDLAMAGVANDLEASPSLSASPSHPKQSVIYIQVGSFANQANANALKAKLEADGIHGVRLFPVNVDGVLLNRVRVGGISTANEADRLSAHLKSLGYFTQQIVVEDE